MLGDRGLADAELRLHDGADVTGGTFALGEQFQDPAPNRIAEDVKRAHSRNRRSNDLYISQR